MSTTTAVLHHADLHSVWDKILMDAMTATTLELLTTTGKHVSVSVQTPAHALTPTNHGTTTLPVDVNALILKYAMEKDNTSTGRLAVVHADPNAAPQEVSSTQLHVRAKKYVSNKLVIKVISGVSLNVNVLQFLQVASNKVVIKDINGIKINVNVLQFLQDANNKHALKVINGVNLNVNASCLLLEDASSKVAIKDKNGVSLNVNVWHQLLQILFAPNKFVRMDINGVTMNAFASVQDTRALKEEQLPLLQVHKVVQIQIQIQIQIMEMEEYNQLNST